MDSGELICKLTKGKKTGYYYQIDSVVAYKSVEHEELMEDIDITEPYSYPDHLWLRSYGFSQQQADEYMAQYVEILKDYGFTACDDIIGILPNYSFFEKGNCQVGIRYFESDERIDLALRGKDCCLVYESLAEILNNP